VFPKLTTSKAISIGSTLAQLQVAYGHVRTAGTDMWQAPDGLVFVANAKPAVEPRLRQIIEIKIGTCGDF
jgi:hypothetical protein